MMGGKQSVLSPLIMGSDIVLASTENKAKEKEKVFSYVLFYEGQ